MISPKPGGVRFAGNRATARREIRDEGADAMTYEEAQKILLDGGDVTDEVRSALGSFDPQAAIAAELEKQKNSLAAAARKDAESKAEALQAKLDEAQAKADEVESKTGTVAEQHAKQMKILADKIDAMQAESAADKAQAAKLLRDAAVSKVIGSQRFNQKIVTDDYARLLADSALGGLDTEQISDPAITGPLFDALRAEKPDLFMVDTPSGAGGVEGTGGTAPVSQVEGSALLQTAMSGDLASAEKALATVEAGLSDGSVDLTN